MTRHPNFSDVDKSPALGGYDAAATTAVMPSIATVPHRPVERVRDLPESGDPTFFDRQRGAENKNAGRKSTPGILSHIGCKDTKSRPRGQVDFSLVTLSA